MTLAEEKDFPAKKAKDVYVLQGAQIDYYWTEIAAGLKDVPGFYDYYTSQWAYNEAKMGHLQIWALSDGRIRAIVLTQLLNYPVCNVFEILAAFGVGLLDFMSEMQDVFEKFAIANNCSRFSVVARPGLARKLMKSFGAEEVSMTLRRDVKRTKEQ